MTSSESNQRATSQLSPGDAHRNGSRSFGLTEWLWLAGFLALIVFTLVRLELFPLFAGVLVDGDVTSIPRALYTVDHPFHTARAELILDAWSSFDTVRWPANHQGGYPAEFFPFGLPGVAAFFSLVSFGTLPIETAWAITIALIFLLPGVAFVLLAKQDHVSPAAGLIALAAHISIASDWTHGGFTELVEWGLATNVAGATVALLAMPLLVRAVACRSYRTIAISSLAIALCAVSNPRSLIAVVVVAVAVLANEVHLGRWRNTLLRLVAVAGISFGLAAPVLFPLIRYRDLYFFVSYEEYASVRAYVDATIASVTWPVLILAMLGIVLAIATRGHRAARVSATAMLLYVAVTAMAVSSPAIQDLIPQLELPRLMPFQRLVTIYLAAYGLVEGIRRIVPIARGRELWRDGPVAVVATVVLVVVFATNAGAFALHEQGLRDVPRTEGSEAVELVEFQQAIELADASAPGDTAILVIGSRLSWHEQLWAPAIAEARRFYYDNWLWYWHRLHDGPYDYRAGHHYPNPSETISEDYLATHGIGAVVVTDVNDQSGVTSARMEATSSLLLEQVETRGSWDVYVVQNAVPLATLNGNSPMSIDVAPDDETITMRFQDAQPGTVLVRQNWFPRWTAEVNGASAPVARAENGYMEVPTEGGDVTIQITYVVTVLDWFARICAVFAMVACFVLVMPVTPIRQLVRR